MPARCPTCGSELAGRAICSRCGTFASVELALARAQQRARRLFAGRAASLPTRLKPHHFLWACAVAPILIIPPLVSLMAAIAGMRRSGRDDADQLEWIAVVSMLNLILSGLVLFRFHFSPAEMAWYLADLIRSWIAPGIFRTTDDLPFAGLPPQLG